MNINVHKVVFVAVFGMTLLFLRAVTSRGFQAGAFVPLLYTTLASIGLLLGLWRTGDMQLDARGTRNSREYGQAFDFIIGKTMRPY